jgi:regulator of sigma E protease
MSWLLTVVGFSALIVLHELGHFTAAKAVGMRVERFALFFPPLLVKVRRGETEYGIGAIPLGGYVKITGMNPSEDLPDEVRTRAYYSQPVWKRIVVIAAGPAVNLVVAFALLFALFAFQGNPVPVVAKKGLHEPAAGVLQPGDRVVRIDGKGGTPETLSKRIRAHRCPGALTPGCRASTPVTVMVQRHGKRVTFPVTPRYDPKTKTMRIGFSYETSYEPVSPGRAVGLSGGAMWRVTSGTISAFARLFESEQRKQLSGVVGIGEVTHQAFAQDLTVALNLLAIISLSLALINLFPFLPLDGGHIFWAVVEKVRGRPVPFSVMERAGVVGFALVLMLFFIGLSNDIGRLQGQGFRPR